MFFELHNLGEVMNTVTYVGTYPEMHLNIFFVILNRVAYLICWMPEKMEFGYMCPCCMFSSHRKAIARAVEDGLANDLFDGKVRWCSHHTHGMEGSFVDDYGDRLGRDYSHLDGELFCAGNAEVDLVEMGRAIHIEAERQIVAGNIRKTNRF